MPMSDDIEALRQVVERYSTTRTERENMPPEREDNMPPEREDNMPSAINPITLEHCGCASCRAARANGQQVTDPADYPDRLGNRRTCERCGENMSMSYFPPRGRGRSRTCGECLTAATAASDDVRLYGRRFGIEIEFVHPDMPGTDDYYDEGNDVDAVGEDVAEALSARSGVRVDWAGYNHNTMSHWKLVTDSSVTGGFELVSPPMTWDKREQVTKLVNTLTAMGMYVDERCGLHVHHDVADLSFSGFRSLVRTWTHAQEHTDGLVSSSRRGNLEWCAPWNIRSLEYALGAKSIDGLVGRANERYRSLNLTCFPTYGTVEVRQHQGTLNAEKILSWVAYGQAIVKFACDGGKVPNTVLAFLDVLPLESMSDLDGDEGQLAFVGAHANATRDYLADRYLELAR